MSKLNIRKLAGVGSMACGLALLATSAHANPWYVSTTGNDSNDGLSPANAFATIQAAVDAASNGHEIFVAEGSYSMGLAVNVNKEVTINGAQAGVTARDAGGRDASDDTTESYLDFMGNSVFNIQANNVTIDGFSIFGPNLFNVITSNGFDNVTVANNFVRRPAATPTPQVVAISLQNGLNGSINNNYVQHFGGTDGSTGALTMINMTDSDISWNEIHTTNSTTDGRTGIHVVGSEIRVSHNLIAERFAKYAIYAMTSTAPGRIYITDNVINGYLQSGIAVRRPRVTIERNTFLPRAISTTISNGTIYVRETNVSDLIIRNNHIANQHSSGSTSYGGIRINNYASGQSSTFEMSGNNLYNNYVTQGGVDHSLSFVHDNIAVANGTTCADAWELRNNWWGAATGPSAVTPNSGTYGQAAYQGERADACDPTFTTQLGGLGDVATTQNATNKIMRFYPWALFQLQFTYTETGGITLTAGTDRILPGDDDRYTKHAVEIDDVSAPAYVTVASPEERLTEAAVLERNSAVSFTANDAAGDPVSFPGDAPVVTVEYMADDVPSGADEDRMRLAKWNSAESRWEIVAGSTVDTVDSTVSGSVSELGTFAAVFSPAVIADGEDPDDTNNVNAAVFSNSATINVNFSFDSGVTGDVEISEDENFAASVVEDLEETVEFTLSSGDGAKTVYYRTIIDGIVGETQSFNITLDETDPVSSVDAFTPDEVTQIDENDTEFDVAFTANDATSGVQFVELFYSFNGGSWTQYPGTFTTSPINFDIDTTGGPGEYDFYLVATDNAGNTEDKGAEPLVEASLTILEAEPTSVIDWMQLNN